MKFSWSSPVAAVAIAAVVFAHVACASSGRPAAPRRSMETGAYTAFGVNLYRELVGEKPDENIFISPASVGFALAMTMNGAAGGTLEAMANTLGRSGVGIEEANTVDSTLIARMNDTMKAVELSVANSLWARRDVAFRKEFLRRNERRYGADVRALSTASALNDWVAEKTNDKITEIVDEIDPETILYLINAIYFKGTWTKEFDKSLTREEPFHLADGATIPRSMMRQSGTYDYLDGEGFQAVRLPYGDGRIGMYVFLPADSSSLERFHAGLTGEKLSSLMTRFSPREGRIGLPRFKIEYSATLNRSLSALGMAVAFDGGRADFTRMIESPLANACIDLVLHKTFIEVNEEGTEAAAVTAVVMKLTSVSEGPRPFEMIVDRPFFFAVVDGETGLVLFMGSIVNPR